MPESWPEVTGNSRPLAHRGCGTPGTEVDSNPYMGEFLRENSLWILAPLALIPLVYLLSLQLGAGGSDDSAFIYNI